MVLTFESLSSNSSLMKKVKALFIFAFRPAGGSLVSLMERSRIPIGMTSYPVIGSGGAGSEERNSLKFGSEPSTANWASFFSNSFR